MCRGDLPVKEPHGHFWSKVDLDASEQRYAILSDKRKLREIAEDYGVSKNVVWNIKKRGL